MTLNNIKRIISKKLISPYYEKWVYPKLVKGKPKIFCIGRNKTGTTSLKKAFENLGYIVGNQRKAEKLLPFYKAGNFKPIIEYCKSAEVFQDFPFSYPDTYVHLDRAFPDSKFILTIRNNPEQWYNSLIKFHSKRFGNGNIPSVKDLQNANYVWKGFMWECNRVMYKTPENDLYNKEVLIKTYTDYIESVQAYFNDKTDKFIVINLSEPHAYADLMQFLNINSPFSDFPWENKTVNLKIKK